MQAVVCTPKQAPVGDNSVNEFRSLLQRIKEANASSETVLRAYEAANSNWTTYKGKAELAFRYGNFAEAERNWLKVLELAQFFKTTDPRRVYTFECLAAFYQAEKDVDKAEEYAKQAVYLTEETYGQNDPRVAICLNALVEMYQRAGRFAEAESLAVRMLRIYNKSYGSHHPDVGTVCGKLAFFYHAQSKLDLAEMMYERAIPIRRAALGDNHPLYIALLESYAVLLEATERQEKARIFRGLPTFVSWKSFECNISTIKLPTA